jgi:hypothetical protein
LNLRIDSEKKTANNLLSKSLSINQDSKLSDEIGKFHEMLALERKLREESQNTMFRMIDEIHNKVMYDL